MKICCICNGNKPLEEFHRRKSTKGGFRAQCKDCRSAEGKMRKYYLKRFGITFYQYEVMMVCQGGKCAACSKNEATAVDHDHKTGEVRGILCKPCNLALGILEDDLVTIRGMIEYLGYGRTP